MMRITQYFKADKAAFFLVVPPDTLFPAGPAAERRRLKYKYRLCLRCCGLKHLPAEQYPYADDERKGQTNDEEYEEPLFSLPPLLRHTVFIKSHIVVRSRGLLLRDKNKAIGNPFSIYRS